MKLESTASKSIDLIRTQESDPSQFFPSRKALRPRRRRFWDPMVFGSVVGCGGRERKKRGKRRGEIVVTSWRNTLANLCFELANLLY